jgi:hypothetical protein
MRLCCSWTQNLFSGLRGDFEGVGADVVRLCFVGVDMAGGWTSFDVLSVPEELFGRVMVIRSNKAVIGEVAQVNMNAGRSI